LANIKSQIKRIGQNNAARDRNKTVRSAIKTTIRKFNEALASGDAGAAKLAKEVGKQLDKAVAKGVIHKNQASNKKSAINKKLAKSKK
jgi:small subunit ribosomal protein S20